MAKRRRKTSRKHRRKNPVSYAKVKSVARRGWSGVKNYASKNNFMQMFKEAAGIVLGIKLPEMILSNLPNGTDGKPMLGDKMQALVQVVGGFFLRKSSKSKPIELAGTAMLAKGLGALIDSLGFLPDNAGGFEVFTYDTATTTTNKGMRGLGNMVNPFLKSNPANVNYMPIAQTKGLGEVRYQKLS